MDPLLERLVVVVILVIGIGAPAGITWMKGHRGAFALGFLVIGVVWWIAALRLARPSSLWACRFYGPEKMERARRRYISGSFGSG